MKIERIIEGFCILPSLNINWLTDKDGKRIYDIQFAWLFWFITTNNIGKKLKEYGY